jgi:type II secretory pathway pseudopilin PulG
VIENPGNRRAAAGFSLVEMAVVTLLIGIFLTMGLSALKATQDASAVSATQTRQSAIKDALIAYLRRNNRLPCADVDFGAPDGIENRATAGDPSSACASSPNARFGIVPYVTLGLARDAAVDGWGNFFSYQVSNSISSDAFNPQLTNSLYNSPITSTNTDWTRSAWFRSGNVGELTVSDRNAAGVVVNLTTSAVAVVVSYGANGFGAYTVSGTRNSLPGNTTDEYQNTNVGGGTTYFHRTHTTDDAASGGAFDDYVIYLTADDLLGPLFKDGTLKPPMAQLADTFATIENAIGNYAVSHTSSTYGGSSCTSGASPKCLLIPYADYYSGNGALNNGDLDGQAPWVDLGLGAGAYADPLGPYYYPIAPLIVDPWGRPIRYRVDNSYSIVDSAGRGIGSGYPPGFTAAYTLTSFGPDRCPGFSTGAPSCSTATTVSDDISVTVTVGDLQAGLKSAMPP